MAGLIVAAFFATAIVVVPLAARNRVVTQAREADHERAANLRNYAESSWSALVYGAWGLLSLVGGLFLIARGFALGWAWIGVSLMFALAIVVSRWQRSRVLTALGDRGRVERSARYDSRAASSNRWGALAVAGWVGSKIVQYPYPDGMPPAAEGVQVAFVGVTGVGALAFASIRVRMFLQDDDLDPTGRSGTA